MESASYAATVYPKLETRENKKGEPDSYFEKAIRLGLALAAAESLDATIFQRMLDTRNEKEIEVADDEDDDAFDFDAIAAKDYSGLGKLWDYWCQDEGSVLVIKAPGYVFAREYFENNPFGIRPILITTVRSLAELTIDNVRYEDGLAHFRRPLIKTDCPPRQQPNFAPFWDALNDYERACARCMWHTAALTDYDGVEFAPQDYRRPAAMGKRLCGLAGLSLDPAVTDFLKGFTAEEFTDEEMQAATAAQNSIMVKLGAA